MKMLNKNNNSIIVNLFWYIYIGIIFGLFLYSISLFCYLICYLLYYIIPHLALKKTYSNENSIVVIFPFFSIFILFIFLILNIVFVPKLPFKLLLVSLILLNLNYFLFDLIVHYYICKIYCIDSFLTLYPFFYKLGPAFTMQDKAYFLIFLLHQNGLPSSTIPPTLLKELLDLDGMLEIALVVFKLVRTRVKVFSYQLIPPYAPFDRDITELFSQSVENFFINIISKDCYYCAVLFHFLFTVARNLFLICKYIIECIWL